MLLCPCDTSSCLHYFCSYVPNTIDINKDEEEYKWLLKVLSDQVSHCSP
jgi:hypothetical protein